MDYASPTFAVAAGPRSADAGQVVSRCVRAQRPATIVPVRTGFLARGRGGAPPAPPRWGGARGGVGGGGAGAPATGERDVWGTSRPGETSSSAASVSRASHSSRAIASLRGL